MRPGAPAISTASTPPLCRRYPPQAQLLRRLLRKRVSMFTRKWSGWSPLDKQRGHRKISSWGLGCAVAAAGRLVGVLLHNFWARVCHWELELVARRRRATKKRPAEGLRRGADFVVGVTRFELVTSSVSGKRSPPELNARTLVTRCWGCSKD